MTYFGSPWPSGVCEDGERVPTPLGEPCHHCKEPIGAADQGLMLAYTSVTGSSVVPEHRECGMRAVRGGIGHLVDHDHWCGVVGDPDGGFSYRQSALMVWAVVVNGALLPQLPWDT